MNRKKKAALYKIPLILLLTVVPLITRFYEYDTNLSQFPWYTTLEQKQDWFLYYKAFAIICISAVMCLALACRYKAMRKEFKVCAEFLPVLAYAVLTFVSSVFSQYRYFSFHGVAEMFESVWVLLGYCVIAFYAYQIINTAQDVDSIMKWLTIGLSMMLVLGTTQAAGHDFFGTDFGKFLITGWTKDLDKISIVFEKGRVFMTLYNPNYVASYFALMIPIEIALLIKSKVWYGRVIYAVVIVASLVCLLASGNRSGIVGFAVTLVLVVILLYKHILKAWKFTIPLAIALGAVVAMFISKNDLIVQKFVGMIQAQAVVEDAITNIETGDEDVAITYMGNVLHASFEVSESEYIKTSILDDSGQEIENTLDNTTNTYIISDERFPGASIQLVTLGGEVAMNIVVDGRGWYFVKDKDNTYYYYNAYGRLDKINNAPRVAAGFLERIFGARGVIWSKTIPMLKDSIIFGSGADTYTVTYPQDDYVCKTYDYSTTTIDAKPHNFYLQVATQSGVLALLAVLIFYIWYFITGFRLYRKASFQDGMEIVGVGLLLATFTYMVVAVLNDSMVVVAPIYWIMMGAGVAINELLKKKNQEPERRNQNAK